MNQLSIPFYLTSQIPIGPSIKVPVGPAQLSVAGPAHFALADVVVEAERPEALGVLVAHGAVGTEAGLVLAAAVLVADVAADARPAVEGAVRVDALRVGHAVAVVRRALVHVVAHLALSGDEWESH